MRCAVPEPRDLERAVEALAGRGGIATSPVRSSPVRQTAEVLAARRGQRIDGAVRYSRSRAT